MARDKDAEFSEIYVVKADSQVLQVVFSLSHVCRGVHIPKQTHE